MATETPRLDTIAPELLKTILGFISGPDSEVELGRVQSLRALAMTSKQLRYEALPYLYRRFEIEEGDVSLALFLRSLCENAELAKCVQIFDAFDVWTTQSQLLEPQDMKILKAALAPLKAAKISISIDAALDRHCACAFYLLLISLTTRLKCLKFSFQASAQLSRRSEVQLHEDANCPCCCSFNESLQGILDSQATRHQFDNLETFEFAPLRDGNIGLLAAASQLPAMQNIRLTWFEDASESYDWTGCTSTSSVEHVRLEESFLPGNDIAGVIACCRTLKSLLIGYNSIPSDAILGTLPSMDTSMVLTSLRPHRECLEILGLTIMPAQDSFSSRPTFELPTFTALSKLDVDDGILLEGRSWDSLELPPNLRVLTINVQIFFPGFTELFRAMARTAQSDLVDLTIAVAFRGNEIPTAPFIGLHEVRGTKSPGEEIKVTRINTDIERSPCRYHLWTEEYAECVKMRFLGEELGQFMDFCAEKVETHGVDFLINTEHYLSQSQSSHTAE